MDVDVVHRFREKNIHRHCKGAWLISGLNYAVALRSILPQTLPEDPCMSTSELPSRILSQDLQPWAKRTLGSRELEPLQPIMADEPCGSLGLHCWTREWG